MPEEIVSVASHPDHPLHAEFLWDDEKAGHQYRLMQARQLIRLVEIVVPDSDNEKPVPKYVSLASDRKRKGGGYRETRDVVKSKRMLAELEETCKRDVDGVLARYEILKELCDKVRAAAGIKSRRKD